MHKGYPGRRILAIGLGSLAISAVGCGTVSADSANNSYYVMAPVITTEPIVSRITTEHPVRTCVDDPGYRSDRGDRAESHYRREWEPERGGFIPGLIGGLVGGIIGNQFGGGNGRKAMTIIGALAGSSIARNAATERRTSRNYYTRHDSRPRQICETRYQTGVSERITGYDVTYEYNGQQFSKRVAEDPGAQVQVRVELATAGEL